MKSHEWKQLACNGILKFCLRGMLGQKQRRTLYKLFDVIALICAEDIDITSIDTLEQQVNRVLALLERDFPVPLQVIVFHLQVAHMLNLVKIHHQLRSFPELSEWMPKHSPPLSNSQLEMRCVPLCSAVKLRNFNLQGHS